MSKEYNSLGARVEQSVDSNESRIYAAKKLSKFFEVDITLKVFGQVIWTWHFPPSK